MEIQDGIYFGMSDEMYHALPMLNASGMKNIIISSMDFWARSWMNTMKEDEKTTLAKKTGKAYHTRILEGRDAFYKKYASRFEAPKDCIRLDEDIKKRLTQLMLPTTGKKEDRAMRLIAADPSVQIYDQMKEAYDKSVEGKTILDPALIDRIEISNTMIYAHPDCKRVFTGGFPEVTIIWTKEVVKADGSGEVVPVRYKARIDYLKTKALGDLKTFSNPYGREIDDAVYGTMKRYNYRLQATHYLMGVEQAKQFVRDRKTFWMIDDQVGGIAPDGMEGFFAEFVDCPEHEFWFVFQQKDEAPLARAYKFPRHSHYGVALETIERATQLYIQYMEHYGTEQPWVDNAPAKELEDERYI